jgi:hypothetical protein
MTSFLRRRLAGAVAAIAIGGLTAVAAHPAVAQDATPGASPAASPMASPVASPVAVEVHPAHIHTGTCATLGGVEYPLADVAEPSEMPSGGAIPVATSVTVVEASLDDLLGEARAINVHESYEDIGTYIACGNLGGTPAGADLFVGLMEQGGSGHSGIAWLHDNGDGSTTVAVFLAHGLAAGAVATPGATPMADGTPEAMASPAA